MSLTAVQSIPELLTDIFAYLVDIWPAPDVALYQHGQTYTQDRRLLLETEPLKHGSPMMGWVNVTFVCGQWRRIAIGSPILWTDINGGLGPHWVDLFVQRSDTAVVTLGNRERDYECPIHFESGQIADPDEVIRVLPVVWHRVRYLHLVYGECELPQAVLDCFAQPNLVLERCELMGNNALNKAAPANGLFAGQSPLLRHFSCNLHSISLPWNASYISQLRSLVIRSRMGLPNLRDLVDTVLRRLYRIEWLDLAYLPTPDTGIVDARSSPVELPRLRRLGLEGSSDSVGSVFQHLQIPAAASVELRCKDRTTADISRIFPAIHSQYSGKNDLVPTTLYVNLTGLGGRGQPKLHVSAWPTMASTGLFDIERDPDYEYNSRSSSILLTLDGGHNRALLDDLIENILPFCRATRLHAVSNSYLSASSHSKIFRHTPNIETLYIGRHSMDRAADCHRKLKAILNALLQSARAVFEGRASLDQLKLPCLQTLHVALDVHGTWHHHADDPPPLFSFTGVANNATPPDDEPLMEKLRGLVVTRATIGAPLRAIRIVNASLKATKPRPRWRGDHPPEGDPVTVPDEVRALLET